MAIQGGRSPRSEAQAGLFGCEPALGTSNYYDAVKVARKVAYEVECLFDHARSGQQLQVDFGDHAEPESASTITMDVCEVAEHG